MIIFVSVILSLNSYLSLLFPLLVFPRSPLIFNNYANIIILLYLLVLVIDASTETKHKGFWITEQNI